MIILRMGTMLNQIGFTGEITYFRNLDSCIRDALQAAQDKNKGPSEPTNFGILQKRLVHHHISFAT